MRLQAVVASAWMFAAVAGLRTPAARVRFARAPPSYEDSLVRPYARRFIGAGAGARLASATALVWSSWRIGRGALEAAAGPARPPWSSFRKIAALWLAMNASLFTSLAAADPAVPGCDGGGPHFVRYPVFTWLVPAIQQIFFFAPAAVGLGLSAWRGAPPRNLVAHVLGGLVGMQLRDLFLMGYDELMTAHHVLSIFVAATLFHGLRRHDDPVWLACAALSVCATEAGSLGANIWGLWKSRAAFFGFITASHVVAVAAAYAGIARHPAVPEVWVAVAAAVPLIIQRQLFCVAECRRGAPSATFEDPSGMTIH